MEKLVEQLPKIIEEAAKSPLGLLALMIIAISALAFFLFRGTTAPTRVGIFLVLFVGCAVFTWALFRVIVQADQDTQHYGSILLSPKADARRPRSKSPLSAVGRHSPRSSGELSIPALHGSWHQNSQGIDLVGSGGNSVLVPYLHRINRAGEGVVPRVVVVRHGRLRVNTDISCVSGQGIHSSHCFLDTAFTDRLVVDDEHALAALVRSAAVIGEVVYQSDLALGQGLLTLDRVARTGEPVVDELRLAVLDVEAPPTHIAGLRQNDPLRAALRNL